MMQKTWAKKGWVKWILILLLAGAGALFAFRGVWRGMGGGGDYVLIYAASRALATGQNPYDIPTLQAIMRGSDPERKAPRSVDYSLYPPTALAVLMPLGVIGSWEASKIAWLACNVALTPVFFWGLLRMGQFPIKSGKAGILAILLLAWASVASNLWLGQTALLASTLTVWGVVVGTRGRGSWGGILLGLGTALKPQLAGVFLLYQLLTRKFRSFWAGSLTLAGVILLCHLNPEIRRLAWVGDLQRMVIDFSGPGHDGYTGITNPSRYTMIHLVVLFDSFLASARVAMIVTGGVCLGLVGWFIWHVRSRKGFRVPERGEPGESHNGITTMIAATHARSPVPGLACIDARRDELTDWTFLSIWTLLSVYHRGYDAIILLVPVVWTLVNWNSCRKVQARILLGLSLAFLTPGGPLLVVMSEQHWLPEEMIQSWWGQGILTIFPTWVLLGMMATVIWAMEGADRREKQRTPRCAEI